MEPEEDHDEQSRGRGTGRHSTTRPRLVVSHRGRAVSERIYDYILAGRPDQPDRREE